MSLADVAQAILSIPKPEPERLMTYEQKVELIKAAHKAGESGYSIAHRFGVSSSRIYQILNHK